MDASSAVEGHRIEIGVESVTPASGYSVWIREGLLEDAGRIIAEVVPGHRYAIVTDSHVGRIYGERFEQALSGAGLVAEVIEFPAGEWNKNREVWSDLTDRMLRSGYGRDSVVVALGGGVVGDLGGFLAATYMRGVPVVQVPTTLLAMIDSSVGGKTGVDTRQGKNLVGAFHHPACVLVDPEVLSTLPRTERASGLAEALKHGLILDRGYYDRVVEVIPAVLADEADVPVDLVRRSIEIKASVVEADAHERGYRQVLNFGHTVAHALESLTGYELRHGEAVATGLVAEAAIGEAAGVTRAGLADEIREVLRSAGLPVEIDSEIRADRFLEAMRSDKKRSGGEPRYTLIEEVGKVARPESGGWAHRVDDQLVREVLFGD